MRRRFSLYGFLKNQRYFEPFLWLALLNRGLSFFEIGLLIAIKEAVVIVLEIPSGAVADSLGRRRAMMLSFIGYIIAFPILGLSTNLLTLAGGMVFYSVGDAFRTGTHKAMIFAWLKDQDRQDERTEFYGYTRSWSKLGSAASIAVGSAVVLTTGSYEPLFLLATGPYVIGLVNFAGYPASLDGEVQSKRKPALAILRSALHRSWSNRGLRRLIIESMGFEGLFHATKDYLQPTLAVTAAALWLHLAPNVDLGDARQTAILLGPVYLALYLGSAVASRRAHRFLNWCGGAKQSAYRLWWMFAGIFACIGLGDCLEISTIIIAAFVTLHLLQNFWRPILVSRIDEYALAGEGATILSAENLARSVATMVWAPLLGALVDAVRRESGGTQAGLWVLGVAGVACSAMALAATRADTRTPTQGPGPRPKVGNSKIRNEQTDHTD